MYSLANPLTPWLLAQEIAASLACVLHRFCAFRVEVEVEV